MKQMENIVGFLLVGVFEKTHYKTHEEESHYHSDDWCQECERYDYDYSFAYQCRRAVGEPYWSYDAADQSLRRGTVLIRVVQLKD